MSELKEQALLERIGELTVQYENKVADLRVAVTTLSGQNDELRKAAVELQRDAVPVQSSDEVLEGIVVP